MVERISVDVAGTESGRRETATGEGAGGIRYCGLGAEERLNDRKAEKKENATVTPRAPPGSPIPRRSRQDTIQAVLAAYPGLARAEIEAQMQAMVF